MQHFWASFASDLQKDPLVHQEICGPDVPCLGQVIFNRMPPEIFIAIMLLRQTYLEK